MGLEEFWGTTPGEVALVIYAAGERQLDRLRLGVHEVWLGRLVSKMAKPDPDLVLPARRGDRRRAPGAGRIDEAYTARERARWRKHFEDEKKARAAAEVSA